MLKWLAIEVVFAIILFTAVAIGLKGYSSKSSRIQYPIEDGELIMTIQCRHGTIYRNKTSFGNIVNAGGSCDILYEYDQKCTFTVSLEKYKNQN